MKRKESAETPESWEDQPANLSKVQRADPVRHLCFIARSEPLYQMRYKLNHLLEAAMYSPLLKDDSPKEKGDWVWFVSEMVDLLELAGLIDDLIKSNKITFSYNFGE